MSFDSKIPFKKDSVSISKDIETDFGPVDFYIDDDIYFQSRYKYDLSCVIKDTLFDFASVLSFSSTDFKQPDFGNCWAVAVLKALFDKSFALQLVQDFLIPDSNNQWSIRRLSRSDSNVYSEFDIRETHFKRSFMIRGKEVNSFFLDSYKDPIYIYLTYGILKAMDSLIRHNKSMYLPEEFVKNSDTMEISHGYFSLSVLYFLFKNIVNDLGRMRFTDQSYRYYSLYFEGLISYEDLRNYDFRVFELLEILNSIEENPDKFICVVDFNRDFNAIDVLSGIDRKIFKRHAYYLKSFNSSINFVTLVDPNYYSLQFHLSFHDFMYSLFNLEYSEFPDEIVNMSSGGLSRVTPLSVLPHTPQIKRKSKVDAFQETWVDFNDHMVISSSVSDFYILMHEGEYRFYDINTSEFLPLMTVSELGGCGEEFASVSFRYIFENPYKIIFSRAHYVSDEMRNLSDYLLMNVDNGYLSIYSPIDLVCCYPRLIENKESCTFESEFSYKKPIQPVFARCFAESGFSNIQIYQTQSNLREFIFVVNSIEYKFKRNLFEIPQFFNLETHSLAHYKVFDDRLVPGFTLSIQHYSYDNVMLKIAFQNITTQFFA